MKKNELIQKVSENTLSSVYSKDDVIEMLANLDDSPTVLSVETKKEVNDLVRIIGEIIDNFDFQRFVDVDYDSAQFEIDYDNRVRINDVDANIDNSDVSMSLMESIEMEITTRFKEKASEAVNA